MGQGQQQRRILGGQDRLELMPAPPSLGMVKVGDWKLQTPAPSLDPGRSPSQVSDGHPNKLNETLLLVSSPLPFPESHLSFFFEALIARPRDLFQSHLFYPHNGAEEGRHACTDACKLFKGTVYACVGGGGVEGGWTAPQDQSRASNPMGAPITPKPHPCINVGPSALPCPRTLPAWPRTLAHTLVPPGYAGSL